MRLLFQITIAMAIFGVIQWALLADSGRQAFLATAIFGAVYGTFMLLYARFNASKINR